MKATIVHRQLGFHDSMKTALGHELNGYAWEFDVKRLAKVFLLKIRKVPTSTKSDRQPGRLHL